MRENMQPRLKPTVQYHYFNQKVYFVSAGSAIEIESNAKYLSDLCQFMDGQKTIDELVEAMRAKYPQECQYVKDALQVLDDLYFLEDDSTNHHLDLSDYEVVRWSRNTEFFASHCKAEENKFKHQSRLKNIKVTLLGLGGLGSHILYDLAALGVQNIRAVDFDRVELSNLNRQTLYSEKDIGRLKTVAASERIKGFLPSGNFEFINKKIASQADIEEIIQGSEIVICVADKPKLEMQSWLNAACVKLKIPFINGGIDNKRAIYCTVMPGQSGCIECWKSNVQQVDSAAYKLLKNECPEAFPTIPWPAMVTFVSLLTGCMLTEFLKIATGISKPRSINRLMAFDFEGTHLTEAEVWAKHPLCAVCGNE